MELGDYKVIFFAIGLIGIVLFATPFLNLVFSFSIADPYTDFWILDSNHMTAFYPSNIWSGENYSIYLGVNNHLGSSAYYLLRVKFGNHSDPLPNISTKTSSALPSLFTYRLFLQDNRTWETQFTFSIPQIIVTNNRCVVEDITINGVSYAVNKPVLWNLEKAGYTYHLFFELWIYQIESARPQYHNRFTGLWLNMTV